MGELVSRSNANELRCMYTHKRPALCLCESLQRHGLTLFSADHSLPSVSLLSWAPELPRYRERGGTPPELETATGHLPCPRCAGAHRYPSLSALCPVVGALSPFALSCSNDFAYFLQGGKCKLDRAYAGAAWLPAVRVLRLAATRDSRGFGWPFRKGQEGSV